MPADEHWDSARKIAGPCAFDSLGRRGCCGNCERCRAAVQIARALRSAVAVAREGCARLADRFNESHRDEMARAARDGDPPEAAAASAVAAGCIAAAIRAPDNVLAVDPKRCTRVRLTREEVRRLLGGMAQRTLGGCE